MLFTKPFPISALRLSANIVSKRSIRSVPSVSKRTFSTTLKKQYASKFDPVMQDIKDTIQKTVVENFGKIIPGNENAPEGSRFSLDEVPDLSGKVAVVTGGSEGIGYGCTHTLLKHNIKKLFILSNDQAEDKEMAEKAKKAIAEEMGQETANKVEWYSVDLSDWEATGKIAFDIASKTDRMDIMINNAGRGIMTYQLSKAGVDLHMAINHIGHVVLTSHLLPLLKETSKKDKVRIVNLASNAHVGAPKDTKFASIEELNQDLGPNGQYGRSKLCSILYAKYLTRHLRSSHPNILANASHPGFVDTRQSTELIHEAFPIGGYGMSVLMQPFKKTQFEGCVSTIFCATATTESGQYVCPPAVVEKGSELANDDALGEQLMDLTRKIVREKTSAAKEGCPLKDF